MSLIRKLAGETVIYGLGSVLPRVLNFLLLTPYLTRKLATDSYGIHGIMYSFAALLMVFYTYRMETAFFRFGSKKENFITSFSTASIGVFFSSIVFTLFILTFSKDIAAVLTTSDDQIYVVYFALIILFDAVSAIPFAKLRLQNRPLKFSILKLLNVCINIAIILFLIDLLPYLQVRNVQLFEGWYDPDKKLDYVFIANLCASGLIFLVILHEYRGLQFKIRLVVFKQMFFDALPLIVVGIAGVVNQLVDRYLIAELLPGGLVENLQQSGIYNACVKIAVLMLLFTTAFNYAAEPFFFKNADRANAMQIYAKVGHVFAIVGSLVFLVVTLYIDVFQYLIGSEFREGLGIVPILLLAYLCLGMYYNFSIWYKLKDKTYYGAIIATIGAVITLSLNFLLVPYIGYYGSSLAALACFGSMSILAYLLGRKHYPIPYPIKSILSVIGTAVALYLVNHFLRPEISNVFFVLIINTILLSIYIIYIKTTKKDLIMELLGKRLDLDS